MCKGCVKLEACTKALCEPSEANAAFCAMRETRGGEIPSSRFSRFAQNAAFTSLCSLEAQWFRSL